jgi:hypothetical protein
MLPRSGTFCVFIFAPAVRDVQCFSEAARAAVHGATAGRDEATAFHFRRCLDNLIGKMTLAGNRRFPGAQPTVFHHAKAHKANDFCAKR